MATASEIKAGLDDIAVRIRDNKSLMEKAKINGANASADLSAIPTDYADLIATIDAFPAGTTNVFEQLAKAEKAKLATEFTALKNKADQVAAIDLDT